MYIAFQNNNNRESERNKGFNEINLHTQTITRARYLLISKKEKKLTGRLMTKVLIVITMCARSEANIYIQILQPPL